METKFEASYLRDEKFTKEFFYYYSYKRPVGILLTVFCILALVSGIVGIVISKEYFNIITVMLSIYILVFRAVRINKSIKITIQRDKESNHGNLLSVQNLVTENSITVKSSLNNDGVEYSLSDITKAYRSKNYIYLVSKAKLTFAFDINNFSKGTPEEFVEFIRQKGIKIK